MKRIRVPENGITFGGKTVHSHAEIMKIYRSALKKYVKNPSMYADYVVQLEDELIALSFPFYEMAAIEKKIKSQENKDDCDH